MKHVSRLLAAQLTSNNLGPGIEQVRKDRKRNIGRAMLDEEEEEGSAATATKISVIGGVSAGSREAKKSKVCWILYRELCMGSAMSYGMT